jgi:hypothetical protein
VKRTTAFVGGATDARAGVSVFQTVTTIDLPLLGLEHELRLPQKAMQGPHLGSRHVAEARVWLAAMLEAQRLESKLTPSTSPPSPDLIASRSRRARA